MDNAPVQMVAARDPRRRLLTPEQVAEILSCSRSMAYKLIRLRAVPTIYVGRLPRVADDDLQAYMAAQRQPAAGDE